MTSLSEDQNEVSPHGNVSYHLRRAWKTLRENYLNNEFLDLRKREFLPHLQKRFHLILVFSVSIVQVVIACKGIENNKGINYAAFAGAVFSLIGNISVAIGKAHHLFLSTTIIMEASPPEAEYPGPSKGKRAKEENDQKKQLGIEKAGYLPNIFKLLIVILTYTTKKILKKCTFGKIDVQAGENGESIIMSAYGLLFMPFWMILFVVDMLTIQLVDTTFVLCAENIKQMPQLDGAAWAFSSLALAIGALLSHLKTNRIACYAFKIHQNIRYKRKGTPRLHSDAILELLALIPETVEEAVSFELKELAKFKASGISQSSNESKTSIAKPKIFEYLESDKLFAPLYNLRIDMEENGVVSHELMFSLTVQDDDWYRLDKKAVLKLGCEHEISQFKKAQSRRFFEAEVP